MNKKEQKVIVAQIKQYMKDGASTEEIKKDFLAQGNTKQQWRKIAKKLPTKNMLFGIFRGIWMFTKLILWLILIIVISITILVLIFGKDIDLEDIDDKQLRDLSDSITLDIKDEENGHLIMLDHGALFYDKNEYDCYECEDTECANTKKQDYCSITGSYLELSNQVLPQNIKSIESLFEKYPEEIKTVHSILEAPYFVAKHLYTIPENFFEADLEASQNGTTSQPCWDCIRINNFELTTLLVNDVSPLQNQQRFLNYMNALTSRINLDYLDMLQALLIIDNYGFNSLPKYKHFQTQLDKKEQIEIIESYLDLSATLPQSFERALKLSYKEDIESYSFLKALHKKMTFLTPWGNIIKITDKPNNALQQKSDVYQYVLFNRPMQNKHLENCIKNNKECLPIPEMDDTSFIKLLQSLTSSSLYHLKHSTQGNHNSDLAYLQENVIKRSHPLLQKNTLQIRFHTLNLALQLYYQDNNKLPESLNKLVPEYISEVPQDIFGEKEIRYFPKDKLLCSIGKNLKEDNCTQKDVLTANEALDNNDDDEIYLNLPDIPYEIIIWDPIEIEPNKKIDKEKNISTPAVGIKRRPASLSGANK